MTVLVVAFDGLDYGLIQKHDCDNLKQIESGKIDNNSDTYQRKTSELFVSFITGRNWEEHGVKGLKRYDDETKGKIVDFIAPKERCREIRGFHKLRKSLLCLLDTEKRKYRREDYNVDTLFEKIEDSKDLFIPAYSKNIFWDTNADLGIPLNQGFKPEDVADYYYNREYQHRNRALFKELDKKPYSFLMCHLHLADNHQHVYAYDGVINEKKIRELYNELDDLAGEIIRKAEDKYDTIIFMSDHGLPTEYEHNENAFYSCNKELFGDKMPKITDFHDLIITSENENGINNIQI